MIKNQRNGVWVDRGSTLNWNVYDAVLLSCLEWIFLSIKILLFKQFQKLILIILKQKNENIDAWISRETNMK